MQQPKIVSREEWLKAPKGRNEAQIMDWVKRNDEYGAEPMAAAACCQS